MTHLVKITTYGCKEYLCRLGLLPGQLTTREARRRIAIAEVQRVVADVFGISLIEMTSARRAREVARPRQAAMYLARKHTTQSLPEIGRRFGDRDHTTVIHAIRQIEKLIEEDAELQMRIDLADAILGDRQ